MSVLPPHPPPGPLQSRFEPAQPGARAGTLLVLLPGAYDGPADFVREGFVQAVRARQLPLDLQLVDAHSGYYLRHEIAWRLLNEVLRPARAQGYARVWLCGISLGGYGSLLFAREHGALLDGVFVMAAFLGRRDLPAAIARAGGLSAWDGTLDGADPTDLALWRWLQGYARPTTHGHPPLWLGYGENDRFIASNRLLGAVLPPGQVLRTPGAHQWRPWQRLWAEFLNHQPWAPPHPAPQSA